MRGRWTAWLALGALTMGLLAGGVEARPKERRMTIGLAKMRDATGALVGVVELLRGPGRTLVFAELQGLSPGFHGFHVHQTGNCTAPDFASAGGHHNPGGTTHGGHAGDMPVVLADAEGVAFSAFVTDRFTLGGLLDADGSAIVVHQYPNNYANIPTRYTSPTGPGPDAETQATGDAGARVACGVVKKKRVRVGPPRSARAPMVFRP